MGKEDSFKVLGWLNIYIKMKLDAYLDPYIKIQNIKDLNVRATF